MGRDGRQHVVAGEQQAALRVVQAQVVERVAGRVDGEPLPTASLIDSPCRPARVGCGGTTSAGAGRPAATASAERGRCAAAERATSPPHGVAARNGSPSVRSSGSTSWSSWSSHSMGGRPPRAEREWVMSVGAAAPRRACPPPPKWSGCEWVMITVWTSRDLEARLLSAGLRSPSTSRARAGRGRRWRRHARPPARTCSRARARASDRELHPQDVGPDLGDLGCAPSCSCFIGAASLATAATLLDRSVK